MKASAYDAVMYEYRARVDTNSSFVAEGPALNMYVLLYSTCFGPVLIYCCFVFRGVSSITFVRTSVLVQSLVGKLDQPLSCVFTLDVPVLTLLYGHSRSGHVRWARRTTRRSGRRPRGWSGRLGRATSCRRKTMTTELSVNSKGAELN